jgi:mono/diheme cytochrome c family protein
VRRVPFRVWLLTYLSLVAAATSLSSASPQKSAAQTVTNGHRIFVQSCAACHDTHGEMSKSGPGLKNYYHDHQPHPTDAAVRAVIQQGKGKMPAFSSLKNSQTDDLVAYLKTL